MRDFSPIYDLPSVAAFYALFSGGKRSQYVTYVGIATSLKRRIHQHLLRRDSSVATGASAVTLMPDHVTEISWWEHPKFSDNAALKAAEQICFGILNPTLRSRGRLENAANELLQDRGFAKDMEDLFKGKPSGSAQFLILSDAMSRIRNLESNVRDLQLQINDLNRVKDES